MIGQIADDAFPARDRESGTAYNEARVSTGTRCETDTVRSCNQKRQVYSCTDVFSKLLLSIEQLDAATVMSTEILLGLVNKLRNYSYLWICTYLWMLFDFILIYIGFSGCHVRNFAWFIK